SISAVDRKMAKSHLQNFERLLVNKGAAASKDDLKNSLLFLSKLLHDYHNKTKVCLFLDEYDAPLHKAFTQGYLLEAVDVIRALFGSVLKGNLVLQRGLLTGILRLAKADLFSGINHLVEDNVFKNNYASHYGFTDTELDELFTLFDVERTDKEKFRQSYNGYNFYQGQNVSTKVAIYNPWSVIGYLKDKNHQLDNYWIGTGGTELLNHLVVHPDLQDALAVLRSGEPIHIDIPKDVTFSGLTDKPATLWPLLVHTGYLTLKNPPVFHQKTDEYEVDLVIPNSEVQSAYNGFYNKWLNSNKLPDISSIQHFNNLITAIVAEDSEKVSAWIKREKASGEPIDFRSEKWMLNPLQLAALSGDSRIFEPIRQHYSMLIDSKDSEGLSVGDYALLSNLTQNIPLERLMFKEDTASPFEVLCYWNSAPLGFIQALTFVGGFYAFMSKMADRYEVSKVGVSGGVMAISTYYSKEIGSWFMKHYFSSVCDRYNKYQNTDPKTFSTLLQYGEYIMRDPTVYVSLTKCKSPDSLVSQFDKFITDVKYAGTKPLTVYLCQSNKTH
ncbi:MAG: AAA family ATPase, partial [Myxococcaceae bacterium]